MKDKVTVIILARNREAWRLKDQVISIRNNENPSILLVDYGSSKEFSNEYIEVCKNLEIDYFRVYSDGLPWSRTHALNCGVKRAKTPFVVLSDIDIVYDKKIFTWCLENYKERFFYQFDTYWLPPNGKWEQGEYAGHGSQGIQFITKSAFEEIGGFDERFLFWGQEDLDWSNRLKASGYTQEWLPSDYKIYHQWHKVEENNHKRPVTASYDTEKYVCQNMFNPILKQDWGIPYKIEDRPILDKIENVTPVEVIFGADTLISPKSIETILQSKKDIFVKLILGPRLKKRPLDKLRNLMQKLLKPFCALAGNKIIANVNTNFDALYAILPILLENGLQDYYISADLTEVYLLWSK